MLLILIIIFLPLVIAQPITDVGRFKNFQIQTTDSAGTIQTGTFTINLTLAQNSDCTSAIYSNSSSQTTDNRGIINISLSDISHIQETLYLCYYRDSILKSAQEIGGVPFADFCRYVPLDSLNQTQINASYVQLVNLNITIDQRDTNFSNGGTMHNDLVMADDQFIFTGTSDGADSESTGIGGGGALSNIRGSFVRVSGNEDGNVGRLFLTAGNVVGGEIRLSTGGSTRMLIDENGLVGIGTGTATPQQTLNVVGYANVSGDFYAGNSTLFVDTVNSRVGIGTVAPVAPLEIQSLVASMRQTRYSDTASQSAGITVQRSRGVVVGTDVVVQDGDRIANFNLRGYDGSNYRTAASIQALIDGTPGDNDMPGRLTFLTTADGASSATERMRIDSSGNVGLNTTNPQQLLNVDGDANITGDLVLIGAISGGGAGHDQFSDFVTNEHFDTSTLTTGSIVFSDGTTFQEDNVGLFYDNTGNRLSLGTVSPEEDFQILKTVPTIRLSDSDAGTDQAVATLIEFYRGVNDNRVGFLAMSSGSNDVLKLSTDYTAGEIRLATGNNSDALTIDKDQNIGIGTSTPQQSLDVRGAGNFSTTIFINNATDISTFLDSTVANVTYAIINSSSDILTGIIACENITGGTDGDFCDDANSGGGGGNLYDQDLNTTDTVRFAKVNISGDLYVDNGTLVNRFLYNQTTAVFTLPALNDTYQRLDDVNKSISEFANTTYVTQDGLNNITGYESWVSALLNSTYQRQVDINNTAIGTEVGNVTYILAANDTEAELEEVMGAINIIVSTEIDTFSELDTLVADQLLCTLDSSQTFTADKTFTGGNITLTNLTHLKFGDTGTSEKTDIYFNGSDTIWNQSRGNIYIFFN